MPNISFSVSPSELIEFDVCNNGLMVYTEDGNNIISLKISQGQIESLKVFLRDNYTHNINPKGAS